MCICDHYQKSVIIYFIHQLKLFINWLYLFVDFNCQSTLFVNWLYLSIKWILCSLGVDPMYFVDVPDDGSRWIRYDHVLRWFIVPGQDRLSQWSILFCQQPSFPLNQWQGYLHKLHQECFTRSGKVGLIAAETLE